MADRFELVERLGKGEMGVVWKAQDREFGQLVALKLLHEMYLDEPGYVRRFEREVEVAKRIDSPNVVRVLGYGVQDGQPYMAMELVEGQTLRQLIEERGAIPWAEARPILHQVASGLAAAHQAGIIHRDIKPSNVLIASDGTAKLADFGIARALDMTRITSSSTMLGTPAYMSPDANASAASDLYSFGCVCYEVLAGVPPFTGETQQQVVMKHMGERPNLDRVPQEAREFVGQLLEKDALRRPRNAAAIAAALAPAKKPAAKERPVKRLPRTKKKRARAALAVLGLFLVASLSVGVSLAYLQPWHSAKAKVDPPPPLLSSTQYEAQLLEKLNAERQAAGLPVLVRQPDLDRSASYLTAEMARDEDCLSTSPIRTRLFNAPAVVRNARRTGTLLICVASPDPAVSAQSFRSSQGTADILLDPEYNHAGLSAIPAPDGSGTFLVAVDFTLQPIAPTGVTGLPVSEKTANGLQVTVTGVEFLDDAITRVKVHVQNVSASLRISWGYGNLGTTLSDGSNTGRLAAWRWDKQPNDPAPFTLDLGPGDWFDATLDFDIIPRPGSVLSMQDGATLAVSGIKVAPEYRRADALLPRESLVVTGLPSVVTSNAGLVETITSVELRPGVVHLGLSIYQSALYATSFSLASNGTTLRTPGGDTLFPVQWGIGERASSSSSLFDVIAHGETRTAWVDFPLDVTGPTELVLVDGAYAFPAVKVVWGGGAAGSTPTVQASPQ